MMFVFAFLSRDTPKTSSNNALTLHLLFLVCDTPKQHNRHGEAAKGYDIPPITRYSRHSSNLGTLHNLLIHLPKDIHKSSMHLLRQITRL
jgi:hypothetical protein